MQFIFGLSNFLGGSNVRKVGLLTILLLLIVLNSGLAAPEDKITRRIISEITWNPEVPRIEVHYIIIQKEKKARFYSISTCSINF
jgi:hypothetical protein